MESLRELYRIGTGPSSSHTMGPEAASKLFKEAYPDAEGGYVVTLYGSLAKTGKGHLTDEIIKKTFAPSEVQVIFMNGMDDLLKHPNTMVLEAFDGENNCMDAWTVYSVGGGRIEIDGKPEASAEDIYPLSSFAKIKDYCMDNDLRLSDYVREIEGDEIFDYLAEVWETMKQAIKRGLKAEGTLAGGLNVQRRARVLHQQHHIDESEATKENRLVCSYAFAVSEENASGGKIVTAPTCGSCGVVPAVLYYEQQKRGFSDEKVLNALAAGGLVGNIIKTNASISGAECGCQAEIGSACSMAAAALGELFDMELDQIEYAAEVAMEHHLGLTCDPINGLVQIPCIERNAVAAMRAINALDLANFLTYSRKISFDVVVKTMYETGKDLFSKYKETSEGGLAKTYYE